MIALVAMSAWLMTSGFGFDVEDMLSPDYRPFLKIEDIQEGDCLRGPEIETFFGAENVDLYYTYECGHAYPLAGDVMTTLACGETVQTGNWTRGVREHLKPGMFWPQPVPCMSSVTGLTYANQYYAPIPEEVACRLDSTTIVADRTERLETKYYEVGQGEAFLPNPLQIQTRKFALQQDGSMGVSECKWSEFVAFYSGWGSFQVRWKRMDCLANKQTECKVAKVEASTNAEGKDCALIKKITNCSAASSDEAIRPEASNQ